MLRLLLIASFLLVPSYAFAWGPLTHMYLGSEVYYLGSILPVGVYSLIRRYRQDFLYGNLMADMILGKKYLPRKMNSHSWDVAVNLFESSKTDPEKAFSYGYLSHLAADTVAHGSFTCKSKNIGHAFLELKADSIIDRRHWLEAVRIERKVQRRNDVFLEKSLHRFIFSFKTNRRLFKSWVIISGLNKERFGNPVLIERRHIERLHEESLDRISDVLQHGLRSEVLKKDPIGNVKKAKPLSGILI